MPSTGRRKPSRAASAALVETFAKPIVSNTRCTSGSRSARRIRQSLDAARQHLLGAAAGRNQADADLDQADVAFGGRLHAVAVQRDLASAAERQPGRADDDRHVRVAQRLRRSLKRADHQIDLVPVAFLRLEQQQHEVGAGGEVRRVVADDQRREVRRRLLDAGVQHLDRVAADGVHLRMELDRQHAVAEIDEAGAGVLPHDAAALLGASEQLEIGPARRQRRRRGTGCVRRRSSSATSGGGSPALVAASTSRTPIASQISNGPSSQPKPHRIARSTSSIEWAISGATRAA